MIRKINKFRARLGRQYFYVMDRFIDICFGRPNKDLQMFEEIERLVDRESKLSAAEMMVIELSIINYKHGTIMIPEERMKQFIIKVPMDNFDKLKTLKALYLI